MVKRESQELRDARRAGAVQSVIVSVWFILSGGFLGAAWFATGFSLAYEAIGVGALIFGSVLMASVVRAARQLGRAEEVAENRERWRRPLRSLAN